MNIITQNSQTYNQTLNLTSTNLAKKKIEPKLKFDSELEMQINNPFNPIRCYLQQNPETLKSIKGQDNISYFFNKNEKLSSADIKYKQMIKNQVQMQGGKMGKDFSKYSKNIEDCIQESAKFVAENRKQMAELKASLSNKFLKNSKLPDSHTDVVDFLLQQSEQIADPEEVKKLFKQQISVYQIKNLARRFKQKKTVKNLNKQINEINYIRHGDGEHKPLKYLVNEGKEPTALEKPMMVAVHNYFGNKPKKKVIDMNSTYKQKLILFPDVDNYMEFYEDNQHEIKQHFEEKIIESPKINVHENKTQVDKLGFRIKRLDAQQKQIAKYSQSQNKPVKKIEEVKKIPGGDKKQPKKNDETDNQKEKFNNFFEGVKQYEQDQQKEGHSIDKKFKSLDKQYNKIQSQFQIAQENENEIDQKIEEAYYNQEEN